MSHAQKQHMIERYGACEMERLEGEHGEPGEHDRIDLALDDAAAEIDAHLCAAFDMKHAKGPFAMLVSIACDLARMRLYDDAAPDTVKDAARRARVLLDRLVNGDAALLDGDANPVPRRRGCPVGPPGPEAQTSKPIFERDTLRGC